MKRSCKYDGERTNGSVSLQVWGARDHEGRSYGENGRGLLTVNGKLQFHPEESQRRA